MSSLSLFGTVFTAGCISVLSPVLPMVLGFISLISSVVFNELEEQCGRLTRSSVTNSILPFLGFTSLFLGPGAIASSIGQAARPHIALALPLGVSSAVRHAPAANQLRKDSTSVGFKTGMLAPNFE